MAKSLVVFILMWVSVISGFVCCQRPKFVNVGAVFTFDSVIGRAAKPAMEAAVFDINKDKKVLNGIELKLLSEDAHCNVFLGSVGALQVLGKQVVAVIGPQSSGIAHMISQIANALQVPLVSYAATDPTLSALVSPFFVRTTQSDSTQMAAMAQLVDFYGWKEVIAIYVDDDYGRNAIADLEDELDQKMSRVYKSPLSVNFDEAEIVNLLKSSKLLGPRVYVVHVSPDPRFRIFAVARKLQMMTENYVWLATDWLSATLDSFLQINRTSLSLLQGVVALRQHTPESSKKRAFASRWREMQQKGSALSGLNSYALQAYDSVWVVAYAIDRFINKFSNITFSFSEPLHEIKASKLQLDKLKMFDGGTKLLNLILQTNFTGVSGHMWFNQDRETESSGYDVINIAEMSIRTVGYWSNSSGFSVLPPESQHGEQANRSLADQKLQNITWPGGKTEKPRGWVIADDERPLRIGVPFRASFVDFVTKSNHSHKIEGYSVDVFLEARKLIPYYVPYRFELFGDGRLNPNYDQLTRMVAEEVFDAAIGDISIVTNRTKIVDFSQPYAASGLVILAPIRNSKSSTWVFLKPFTLEMWCVTAASFVMIAVVIWVLEHRVNDEFRGPPRRQIVTMFMFSFSTLFKANQETTVSSLGRMVMVVWLFLLMVVSASYTASLTSILTIQQLSSPITGIDSLIASNWPIGYQVGSFAYGYLSESLHVSRSRLVCLRSPEEFEKALRLGPYVAGGVAAVVDELPYVEMFLKTRSDFGIIGQPFTRGGMGFAFHKKSPLAVDMSTAILKLSETGELQNIYKKWFCKKGCWEQKKRMSESNQVRLVSFCGLYILCGGITLGAFLLYLLRVVRQFLRYKRRQMQQTPISSTTRFSQVFFNFLDFIDEKEEAIKKMFKQCDNPAPQTRVERSNAELTEIERSSSDAI